MEVAALLVIPLIGAVAGLLVSGYGFGLFGNIVVGIAGAFMASLLFPLVGLSFGFEYDQWIARQRRAHTAGRP